MISVVIPTYNRKLSLCDAIVSVLNQSSSVYEIIVVDDGSTDETCDLMFDFLNLQKKIKYIKINNSGPGLARNLGISIASGDWIAFLDSDDVWSPLKVSHFISALEIYPQLDFYFTGWTDTINNKIKINNLAYELKDNVNLIGNFYSRTPTVVVRKSILDSEILFGNGKTCEDHEFFWKAIIMSKHVVYCSSPDTVVRKVDNSLTLSHSRYQKIFDKLCSLYSVYGWSLNQKIGDIYINRLRYCIYWTFKDFLYFHFINFNYLRCKNYFILLNKKIGFKVIIKIALSVFFSNIKNIFKYE